MFWTGIGVTLVIAVVVMVVILRKRPAHTTDLGSVSDHWIA
jgi:hypothetical protein